MTKLVALIKDVVHDPAKYRKAAVVPAGVLVYVISTYFGADAHVTLDIVTVLAAAGVYKIPNAG